MNTNVLKPGEDVREVSGEKFNYTSAPFIAALASVLLVQISVYMTLPLGIIAAIWIVFKRERMIWPITLLLLPLLLMIAVGVALGLESGAAHRDILRDGFYISIFISLLIVGLSIGFGGLTFNQLIMVIVLALTLQYANHAIQLVTGIGANYVSVGELRDELGQTATGSAVLVLPSLFVVPFAFRLLFISALIPNFLSFSRSNVITFIFLMAAKGLNWLRWLALLAVCAGGFYYSLQSTSNNLLHSFVEKLMFSVQEVGDTSFYGEADIHQKWRAYERYIVDATMDASDGYTQLLGLGFGSSVQSQINKRQDSAGIERTFLIPTFHDSSLFIRLKLGMMGLIIWIAWWLVIAWMVVIALRKVCDSRSRWLLHCAALGITCVISSFLYGYPLMKGVGPETLMLGYLVAIYLARSPAKNSSALAEASLSSGIRGLR